MDAVRILEVLAETCRALEAAGEHAAAAHVGHAMTLMEERFGPPAPPGPPHRGDPAD